MVEPIFKAPLPPSGNIISTPTEKQPEEPQQPEKGAEQTDIKQKILPYLWYVLGGTFFLGLIFGAMMSGGEEVCTTTSRLYSVTNPDIHNTLPLCGQTDQSKECVLYLMNKSTTDAQARDFFEEAAKQMIRRKEIVGLDNALYANTLIPPGYFAEIKITAVH